jgi:hypothetical protein
MLKDVAVEEVGRKGKMYAKGKKYGRDVMKKDIQRENEL